MNRKYRIGLIGEYGSGNLGDELLFSVISNTIKLRLHTIIPCIKNSEVFSRFHGNNYEVILCESYRDLSFKHIRQFKKMDLLIFGGGGLVNEYYPQAPRWIFLWSIYSKLLNIPYAFLSIGATDIQRISSKIYYRLALNNAARISSRDSKTTSILTDLTTREISTISDAVFLSNSIKTSVVDRKRVVLSLRNWKFSDNISNLISAIRELISFIIKQDDQVVITGVCFSDEDLTILKLVLEGVQSEIITFESFDSIIQIYKESYLTIGMRYHSLILSILAKTPFIGIAYDLKVENITKEYMGNDFLITLQNPDDDVQKVIASYKNIFSKTNSWEKSHNDKKQTVIDEIDAILALL